jgi:integrase
MRATGRTAKQIDQQTVTCSACGKRMTRKSLREKSKLWWGSFRHPVTDELKRVPLKVSDKTAATTLLAAAQRRAALEHAGLVSSFEDHEKRPLLEHVADYEQSLRNRNRTADYLRAAFPRLRKTIAACKFVCWTDISREGVEAFIATCRRDGTPMANGKRRRVGERTLNFYVVALKLFLNWMVETDRAGSSPLARMRLDGVTDADERRAPTPSELVRIIDTAKSGDEFQGVGGVERAMLYMVAASTGFRFGECRALEWGWFDFGERPIVTLPAAVSKHREQDVQPLSANAIAALEWWRARQGQPGPRTRVFPSLTKDSIGARLLRHDTDAAKIAFRDDARRKLVFHSIRDWYITFIRRSTDPITAATLARHKDRSVPVVTDRYSHSWVEDQFEAVNRLPKLWGVKPEAQQARATGTDGGTALVQRGRDEERKALKLQTLRSEPNGHSIRCKISTSSQRSNL